MDVGMTGIVLAGGKATRMGGSRDKAFLKIGGETIIDRQLKALRNIFKEIIIVTNSPDRYRGRKGVKIISDIVRERGPAGGIYSGLLASGSFYNFIVACDMPFINEGLVGYMINNIKDFDIFVPKIDNKFHPLCGIYSKNCISVIERQLSQGILKVSDIFSQLNVKFISKKMARNFDKDLLCLENINTPRDLKNMNKKRRWPVSYE